MIRYNDLSYEYGLYNVFEFGRNRKFLINVYIFLDESMEIIETSEEDRRIFKRLLLEYVEATDKMSVETLELWHTRIRQSILQHKKDHSRLPLFEVGSLN